MQTVADASTDAKKALEDRVGFLLQRAHNGLRAAVVATLDGSGINPGQLAVLGALGHRNDLTQRALTIATGIEKSSMVIFVDRLEADGWVERRLDGDDRRARLIHLTAKGRKRLASLGPRLVAVEERFVDALSRAERTQLVDLLRRLGPPDPTVIESDLAAVAPHATIATSAHRPSVPSRDPP